MLSFVLAAVLTMPMDTCPLGSICSTSSDLLRGASATITITIQLQPSQQLTMEQRDLGGGMYAVYAESLSTGSADAHSSKAGWLVWGAATMLAWNGDLELQPLNENTVMIALSDIEAKALVAAR